MFDNNINTKAINEDLTKTNVKLTMLNDSVLNQQTIG